MDDVTCTYCGHVPPDHRDDCRVTVEAETLSAAVLLRSYPSADPRPSLRTWAHARIAECRRQELKFGGAWELRAKHQHGPPQALVEAWQERMTLEEVLRRLEENGEARTGT